MDRPWAEQVLEAMGPRYRLGDAQGEAHELLYRSGKVEFRPTRVLIGGGASGREVELTIDVRVPKGSAAEASEPLVIAVERYALTPRGYTRQSEETSALSNQSGEASGYVRSLRYRHEPAEPAAIAVAIRAIVESIDVPIVVGIHEAHDLVAKDPAPLGPRTSGSHEPLDKLYFELEGGLLGSLVVVVDPNDRTLRVQVRKLVSSRQVGEVLKLAHVAKLGVRVTGGQAQLIAIRRDGSELPLATGVAKPSFVATAARLAKAILIPIIDL